MKKRLIIILILCFSVHSFYAQEICETTENKIEDKFSINKCNVEVKKDKNERTAKITVVSKRYLKKRNPKRNRVSGVASLNTSGLDNKNVSELKNNVQQVALVLNDVKENEVLGKTETNISFNDVDEIPRFKTCENEEFTSTEDCFNYEMRNHILDNLTYPEKAYEEGIEAEVWISFTINKKGVVTNIKAINSQKNAKLLTKEAIRVIKRLPNFLPGKHKGKETSVVYTFPINFNLQ